MCVNVPWSARERRAHGVVGLVSANAETEGCSHGGIVVSRCKRQYRQRQQ